jgi:ABC-type sugar transport system, periplasmic component
MIGMKKVCSVLVTSSLLLAMAGCTGFNASSATKTATATSGPFGKYAKPVTLTIGMSVDPNEKLPKGDTYQNNQYTRYIKKQLNVDVKVIWTAAASNYDQKVDLAIASNTLPDGMVVNDTQFHEMETGNQLADLTASYKNYASPVMKKMINSSAGLAVKNVTYNGKMVGLTSVSDGDMVLTWIRKDWMDKLGLKPPKTVNDLENIARQFVKKDPGGNGAGKTIGITGPQNGGALYATFLTSGTNNYGFDPIFNAYRSYPGWWVKDSNGKPVYGSIQPETKTALAKLREMYADGLIDKEMGIRQDASQPIISGQSGIFFGGWWMGYGALPDVIKNNPKANFQAYLTPVNSAGQYKPHASAASYTYTVIRKGYAHPELAIKLNNLLIRDESTFDTSKAIIGDYPLRIPFGMKDESTTTVKALRDVMNGKKSPADFANAGANGYKLLSDDVKNVKQVKLKPYSNNDIQYWKPNANMSVWSRDYSLLVGWAPFVDNKYTPVYSLTYSQTKTIQKKWTNLKALEDSTFLKIIMGSAPLSDFDKFVSSWKAQGGTQITSEVAQSLKSK